MAIYMQGIKSLYIYIKNKEEIIMNEQIIATKKLTAAIIAQAIADWRKLEKADAYTQKYNGLRRFFKSEWCAWLCAELGTDNITILNKLEVERKNYVNKIKEVS